MSKKQAQSEPKTKPQQAPKPAKVKKIKVKNPPASYPEHKPDPKAKALAESQRMLSRRQHPVQSQGMQGILAVARPTVNPHDWQLAMKAQARIHH